MAVYTSLSLEDASRITDAHSLGPCLEITPVSAGSVNSNFFLRSPGGRHFLRIYEEQGTDGVAYEWSLLDFLAEAGIPVPQRVAGPAPGAICVAGKPTAVFEVVAGEDPVEVGFGGRGGDLVDARGVHAQLEGFGEAEECGELPPGFQLREERAVNVSSERDFLLGKTPVNTKLSYNSPKSGSNIFFHGREGIAGRGKELLVITNN